MRTADIQLEQLIDLNIYQNILNYVNNTQNLNCYATDSLNCSILSWAIFYQKNLTAIEALINSNINFDFSNTEGETPLMIAAQENRIDVINLLLGKNKHHITQYINLVDNKRQTALHFAVHYTDNAAVVASLLKSGINKNIHNTWGQNALDICTLKSHSNSAKIL